MSRYRRFSFGLQIALSVFWAAASLFADAPARYGCYGLSLAFLAFGLINVLAP
jgi:hypothetical protein